MRCTDVADRPFPDGKFPGRDIGDRGRSCFASDFVVLVLSEAVLSPPRRTVLVLNGCLSLGDADR